MQPLENPKQFVGILHVEADAVVADEERDLIARRVYLTALPIKFANN
jgi:hypothetical protein